MYINIENLQIQNVDKNKWIVITTQDLVGTETCKNVQQDVRLNGTYLVDLDFQCSLKLKHIILRGNVKLRHKFQPIPLIDIKIGNSNHILHKEIELPNLNRVDLTKIDELQKEITLQKNENAKLLNNGLYYDRTSVWTVLLYIVIIIAIIIVLLIRYLWPIYLKSKLPKAQESNIF